MNKSILIIEDDASIRSALIELLQAEGYTVSTAENGERGLAALKENAGIDLILLDLTMPIMSGQVFLIEFKKAFPELATPIVVMTAAGAGEIPEDHPKHQVLKKPMDVDVLINKIVELT